MMSLAHQIQNWVTSAAVFAYPIGNLIYQAAAERRAKRLAASVSSADFSYRTFQWGWLRLPLFLALPVFILWVICHMHKSFIEVGWLLSIAMTLFLLLLLIVFTVPLVALSVSLRDTQRRRVERVQVSREGIVLFVGNKTTEALWADVTDYYIAWAGNRPLAAPCYIVVTQHGSFDFTANISGFLILKEIISRRALQSPASGWQQRVNQGNKITGKHQQLGLDQQAMN